MALSATPLKLILLDLARDRVTGQSTTTDKIETHSPGSNRHKSLATTRTTGSTILHTYPGIHSKQHLLSRAINTCKQDEKPKTKIHKSNPRGTTREALRYSTRVSMKLESIYFNTFLVVIFDA